MFTQMRAAYQASRCRELSARSDGPRTTVGDILRYATIGGAQTLRLDNVIGSPTPGKQADLIVVRADRPDVASVYDPYSTVVLQMDRSHVDTVLVAGRPAKHGGKFLVHTTAFMANADALARRLITAGLLDPSHVGATASHNLDSAAGSPRFR